MELRYFADEIQFILDLSILIFFYSDVARAIELLEKLQESGEVPVHKLQSLKKVLQSEFCTAIREVWHEDFNNYIQPYAFWIENMSFPHSWNS